MAMMAWSVASWPVDEIYLRHVCMDRILDGWKRERERGQDVGDANAP